MARKLLREEVRKRLHESVQKLVAEQGIENLTTRKITYGCGLSDPYLYQCYDGIPDLLEAAFLEIDREIGELISAAVSRTRFNSSDRAKFEQSCLALWLVYWNYLMENDERTIFYWRFYQSGYLTAETDEKRQAFHSGWYSRIKDAASRHHLDRHADVSLMFSTMVDSTLLSAVKLLRSEEEQPDMALSTKTVFRAVFAQIFNIFDCERQNAAS